MAIKHGIVETTLMNGCMNKSGQSVDTIDNGSIVALGNLVEGERDVYVASKPSKESKVYLVAHPSYGYDDKLIEERNEDNYTNEAGKVFRTYELLPERKFKVSSNMIKKANGDTTPLAKGQYVFANGEYKMEASVDEPENAAFVGIIETIEETGFPYFGSSAGTKVTDMGYGFDTAITKVKIRVISNK